MNISDCYRQDQEFAMLDLTGILFSSVMMLIVIVRAVQLDREQPWFQTIKGQGTPAPARQAIWKRQN
jgi:hypothetical protein